MVTLIILVPKLADIALFMGPSQFFMLALFGLSMVATIGKGDTAKGLILGCLELVITAIGTDVMTGTKRFTFGNLFILDGIPFVPVIIGLFAMFQVFLMAESNQ